MSSPSRTPLPPASLVVCSRNRRALLRDTIESVLAGQVVPAELVVVDQSDEPNSFLTDWVSESSCRLVYRWSRASGASRARNEGIEACSHSLIALLDDDMLVEPDWFPALIGALVAAGPRTAVTGRVMPAEVGSGGNVPSTKTDDLRRVYTGRTAEGVLYTGNMALPVDAIADVGLFDERLGPGTAFPSAEDNDLGYRLLCAGYRIVYEPDAVVYHRAWRTEDQLRALRWGYGLGRGAFYAKHAHLRERTALRWIVHDLGVRLRRVPRRLGADRRGALDDLVFCAGLCTGFGGWFLRRRR